MEDQALKHNISRWVIFALVALALLIPLLVDFSLPNTSSKVVRDVYDDIGKLQPGDVVILSFDFDPASTAELEPMTKAILRQCFKKDLKVICMTLWGPQAPPLMKEITKSVASEPGMNKVAGRDYVLLPFKPGGPSVIVTMGQDFYLVFPEDDEKVPTKGMGCLKNVRTLKDVKYVVALCAGQTLDYWIFYGQEKYGINLAGGCTAVMATDYYPYLQTRQLRGLIGGLGGAYQYEVLTEKKEKAAEGMRPQSVVHILIVLLIVAGNVVYFVGRARKSGMP
jgi:hypothetical protein